MPTLPCCLFDVLQTHQRFQFVTGIDNIGCLHTPQPLSVASSDCLDNGVHSRQGTDYTGEVEIYARLNQLSTHNDDLLPSEQSPSDIVNNAFPVRCIKPCGQIIYLVCLPCFLCQLTVNGERRILGIQDRQHISAALCFFPYEVRQLLPGISAVFQLCFHLYPFENLPCLSGKFRQCPQKGLGGSTQDTGTAAYIGQKINQAVKQSNLLDRKSLNLIKDNYCVLKLMGRAQVPRSLGKKCVQKADHRGQNNGLCHSLGPELPIRR